MPSRGSRSVADSLVRLPVIGLLKAVVIRYALTSQGGLSVCLATVEHSLDRYTQLVRSYLFVAKPHAPIAHPESVRW